MDDANLTASVLRFAARETLTYLQTSTAWQQFSLAENQFHTGDDPIVADGEAHQRFEIAAQLHPAFEELNLWGIVGEEKIRPTPTEFNPGTRVLVVDSLDGSTLWAMMRQGYCVAALSLLANDAGELVFECGVIATPVHVFTLIGKEEMRYGSSLDGPKGDTVLFSSLPESEVRPPSLAINGYKARDRDLVRSIMRNLPGWDIVTIAGNTISPYVVTGMLTAAVNTRHQCTWDALGVLFCTSTDATVGALDGTIVSGPTFRRLFDKLLLQQNVRCVPPMIAAKNLVRFKEVATAVQAALEEFPPQELMSP